MILIFDLDDTLYDESTYVESGLRAVADYGKEKFGLNANESFHCMKGLLDLHGRGSIFDRWLSKNGMYSKKLVQACVKQYRHHRPCISLNSHASRLLPKLKEAYPLYLVTDGHKIAQQRKIDALGIEPLFRRMYITHRYGVANAKPSIYCFERIRERESCDWQFLTYVGDNPAKDFVGLNAVGAQTIRVLTGSHRNIKVNLDYDAKRSIVNLSELSRLL